MNIKTTRNNNHCILFLMTCLTGLTGLTGLTLSGCGGSESATSNASAAIVNPAHNTTGVERNAAITASFNEDMFAATFNNFSITLSDGSTSVAGVIDFDALTNKATFTPATKLAVLRHYSATLSNSITNLAGNPIIEQTWSFTTRDGAWGDPALLETNNVDAASSPEIAFDPSGNAIAIWEQTNNIWASRYDAGTGMWSSAENIDTNTGVSHLKVAFDANGNALAIWSQNDAGTQSIRAITYDAGTASWGASELIEANPGDAWNPQIGFDSDRNAIAVWQQPEGGVDSIWANRYTPSGGWGTATVIENKAEPAVAPQIAVDDSGKAIAVWVQTDGGVDSIWTNQYTSGGGWSVAAATAIETEAGVALTPQIAFDSSGNALALWVQHDGTYNSIRGNRYTSGLGWSTAAVIEDDVFDAKEPQIAFDANGNAIALWSQNGNMMANRYISDTGWGTAEGIEANAGSAGFGQLSIDHQGNAIAVWRQTSAGFNSIWSNRYSASTGWGTAAVIENSDALAYWPQIAIDSSGNAISVWLQIDSGFYSVFTNRFE